MRKGWAIGRICPAVVVAIAVHISAAYPAGYPERPIKIVVPNEPGGIYDLVARLVSKELSNRLSVSVYVENKPGAGSIVGSRAVAVAAPDGYTLLMGGLSNIVFNAALYKSLSYDPRRDFVPVSLINKFSYVLVGRRDLQFHSLLDVVDAARRAPNALTIGTPGAGSAPQIIGAAMMKEAKLQLLEVPYKGVQAPLTDMLAGRIDLMFVSQAAAMPYIREGRLKALATSDVRRNKLLPGVPTLLEAGVDVSMEAWLGLFAPARTEAEILDLLRVQTRASLPAMKKPLEAAETEVIDLPPDTTEDYLRRQYDTWTEIIRNIDLILD